MLQYRVILSWGEHFIFDDPQGAMDFAVIAIKTSVDSRRVTIELISPEVEEAEQND